MAASTLSKKSNRGTADRGTCCLVWHREQRVICPARLAATIRSLPHLRQLKATMDVLLNLGEFTAEVIKPLSPR